MRNMTPSALHLQQASTLHLQQTCATEGIPTRILDLAVASEAVTNKRVIKPIPMSQKTGFLELRFLVFTQKCFPPDLYVVEKQKNNRVWFFKWQISGKQSLCFSGNEKHEKQENTKNSGGGIIKNSKSDFSFEKYCTFHSCFVIS